MSRSQILKIVAGLAVLVLLLDYMGTYQMSNEEKAFSFSAVLVAIGKWIMGRLTDSKKESKPATSNGGGVNINPVTVGKGDTEIKTGKVVGGDEVKGDKIGGDKFQGNKAAGDLVRGDKHEHHHHYDQASKIIDPEKKN